MAQASLKAGPVRPQAAEFNWQDPLDLEHHLSEDERMIRDSVRAFAQDKLMPRVQTAFREEKFDREIMREMGEQGLLGMMTGEAYGGAGLGLCCLWARGARDRARRFWLPLRHERAELARHASDRGLWQRGAEEKISAEACRRRVRRLFRPDRARCGLRSRQHADTGEEDERRLSC